MDEKHAPMPPPIRRGLSPLRVVLATGYLAFAAVLCFYFTPRVALPLTQPGLLNPERAPVLTVDHELVPLEAHIMSKCPDARVSHRPFLVASARVANLP
jgi:hypothetical protein